MNEQIVKIQSRGVITIPKKFRKIFGLKSDEYVRIRLEKGRLVVEPVKIVSYLPRQYTEEEIKEFIALDEKETKELKNKGIL